MKHYCLDTHALVFWTSRREVSVDFIAFLDDCNRHERLWVSAVCFWEIALLVKRGRLELEDVGSWKKELCLASGLRVINPDADDMIESTLLPDHHQDPFDRLLVSQAKRHHAVLVTRDRLVTQYPVDTFWLGSS